MHAPNPPMHAQVVAAFADMRGRLSGGELFVVMFAGHGAKATSDRPSQRWSLTEAQQFDDSELADQLLALPDGIDIVVVSDCCYGEGFFCRGPDMFSHGASVHRVQRLETAAGGAQFAGSTDSEQKLLTKQSQALARVLFARFDSWRKADSPMVCISAASKDDEVAQTALPELADSTTLAADLRQTYLKLGEDFERQASGDAVFHVDARPKGRLREAVLGR